MSSYLSLLQASLASFVGELFALVYTGFGLGMWFPELARRAPPQTFEGQLRNLAYWSRRAVAGSPLAETDMGCHVLKPCHVFQHIVSF